MFGTYYIFCGILYAFYTSSKIIQNKEQFMMHFEREFGENENPNTFFVILFFSCLLTWPFMMLNEIKNNRGL